MPSPIISKLTPNIGWPGTSTQGKYVTGTRVVITGQNFLPPSQKHLNKVTFTGQGNTRVKTSVFWAYSSETQYAEDKMIRPTSATTIGQIKANSISSPRAVAVSKYGLHVAGSMLYWRSPGDFWNIRFFPFKPPHKFVNLSGIASDEAGNVYLANSGQHRIEKYNMGLGHKALWGAKGTGNGQFNEPSALDVATISKTTYVFVSDVGNKRVVRTKDDGSDFRVFTMPKNTGVIHGIAAHPAGDVYCTDSKKKRILHFDSDGKFFDAFGSSEFSFPLGIDVDFDGFIYVVDNGDRMIKKFDSNYKLVAEFGLTIGKTPKATVSQLELIDPVDVAVTDDKAVYIADRARNYIVRWTPEDSEELHVDVPEGAVTGPLRVEVNNDYDEKNFTVWQLGKVSVKDAFVTQGIEEYPMVVRKKTAAIVKLAVPLTTLVPASTYTSFWGHPAFDRIKISGKRNGTSLGNPLRKHDVFTNFHLDDIAREARFSLIFEMPAKWLTQGGNYEFDILVERSQASGKPFQYKKTIKKEFKKRRRLSIGAIIVSHLGSGGQPAIGSLGSTWYYYSGDPQKMNSWVNMDNLLSGFAHYNRLFPTPHGLTDVRHIGQVPTGGISDGISDSEVKKILKKLEIHRDALNESPSMYWKFIIGIVDRAFTSKWSGVTSPESGNYTAIVSIDKNKKDVGSVVAHELAHQYFIVRWGDPGRISEAHSNIAKVATSRKAWNSLRDRMVSQPVAPMVHPDYLYGLTRDDLSSFFPAYYTDKAGKKVDGDYKHLFDDLPNPHPPEPRGHEVRAGSSPEAPGRPAGSSSNLTLVGEIGKDDSVLVDYCYVGEADAPVTQHIESIYQIALIAGNGRELLIWPIPVNFELLFTTTEGKEDRHELEAGLFRVSLPYIEETRTIEIRRREHVLYRKDVPEGSPELKIVSPAGGEDLAPEDEIEVQWHASHPEKASLLFRVEYSHDDGQTYQLVEHNIAEMAMLLRNWAFPGGEEARIRVTASDGFHRVKAISEAFRVARKKPTVHILWPAHGEMIPEGQRIRMAAVAEDPEDGVLADEAITWFLNRYIKLGEGAEVTVSELSMQSPAGELTAWLPPGTHTLTVRAKDSDGNEAEESVSIVIAQDSDRDGYTDDEEREHGTDPFDPFDNPGNVHSMPFGQWQVSRDGTWTRFEVSNLSPQKTMLEVGFVKEDGQSLQNMPIAIQEEQLTRTALTDSQGQFTLKLGPQASATFALRLPGDVETEKLFGYGTIRLVAAEEGREASFLAHGWIRYPEGAQGAAPDRAYEGTVVINCGQPFTLQAPLTQMPKTVVMNPRPIRKIQDLGSLMPAAAKGVIHSSEESDDEDEILEVK